MGKNQIKILKGQVVTSISYIVFGVCLVCMPVNMINVICKFVFGILLILVGLYHILIYVAEKLSATIFDLFSGGVLLVVGVFLFMNPQIVIKLLPVPYCGTFILVDSIWTLKGSFRLKKRNMGTWKFLLIGSLIFIGLGIALVVNPFTMAKRYGDLRRIYFPCQRNPGPDFHDPSEKRSERTETGSGSSGCRGRIHRRRIFGCHGRLARSGTRIHPGEPAGRSLEYHTEWLIPHFRRIRRI